MDIISIGKKFCCVNDDDDEDFDSRTRRKRFDLYVNKSYEHNCIRP
jgi:hypothetical protein